MNDSIANRSQTSGSHQARRRRRATYISTVDQHKSDPFRIEMSPRHFDVPESLQEINDANEQRLWENVPPHFGKI